jgi:hypothetical protein
LEWSSLALEEEAQANVEEDDDFEKL